MDLVLIPGYRSLFGPPQQTYEEIIQSLPSSVVISIAIVLNNELRSNIPKLENQIRMRMIIANRFSALQRNQLINAYSRFGIRSKGFYQHDIFGRRYLIAMILRELNRNAGADISETTPQQEFDLLMAYLMMIDEVNIKDSELLEEAKQHRDDPHYRYRLLWTPQIHQFQFNEKTVLPFEVFKLLSFAKYALDHYTLHLKRYLQTLGFNTLSGFTYSFFQLAMTTTVEYKDKTFRKLTNIIAEENQNIAHLDAMSINILLNTAQPITLPDIKRFPLFKKRENEYLIIDHDLYIKKLYKGPFFELRSNTDLSRIMSFNNYSNLISKEVMEGVCFQSIIQALKTNKNDFVHFDNGTDNVPDCYYRRNLNIYLLEFKANIVPDSIPENPSFDDIKIYIDQRLILNQGGSPKGITQLANQISLLKQRRLNFDENYCNQLYNKHITVYPIICLDDFYFTLPGVNEYLNDQFTNLVDPLRDNTISIKPVTLITLDLLYELIFFKVNMKILEGMIDRYWHIINARKRRFDKDRGHKYFLKSAASFNEIFYTILAEELGNRMESGIDKAMSMLNITQEELDKEL